MLSGCEKKESDDMFVLDQEEMSIQGEVQNSELGKKISGHWKNYHYRVSGSIYLSVFLGSNANNLTKAFNKIFWFCVSNF